MECNCKNVSKLAKKGEREEQTLWEKTMEWVKNLLMTLFVTIIVIMSIPFVGVYVIVSILVNGKVLYPERLLKHKE